MLFARITLIIYLINIVFIIALIFFDKKPPSSILLWSLILLLIPVFGLMLYILFGKGPNFGSKRKFLNKFREDEKFKDIKTDQQKSLEQSGLSDDLKEMAQFNFKSGSLFSTDNEAEIFDSVTEFYSDMLKAINNAKNTIYAEYYMIRDDEWGREIINKLTKRAAEGLSVKLIYDDVGCWGLRKDFFYSLQKCGGEVYSFFPSFIKFINRNLNYRNHRKMMVIDGVYAYMGGSNLGDEYTGRQEKTSPWTDCNIRLKGSAATHLNIRFLQDFSFAANKKVNYKIAYHNTTNYLPVQILSDGPDTNEGSIEKAYIKAIYGAKKSVYIQTPYLIPDEAFKLALSTVAKSGVDVKVMIPSKPDKKYVYYATLNYATELIREGVKVYKREGFLHSKTLIIDDELCSIGSFNIDIRSFYLQFELTAFIYDKAFTQKLTAIFNKNLENSIELDKAYLAARPLKQKIFEKLMRLLTPIM